MAVPAPETWANLKLAILRYNKLKNDTTADANAEIALRSGLARLAAYPMKSALATAELTLTAGQNTVSVPSDFNLPFSVHALDANSKRAARYVYRGEEDFDFVYSNQEGVAGTPTFYTLRGGNTVLEFDRSPEASYVTVHPKVRLRYYKRIDTLNTSTSTLSIPPEWEEFLIWNGRREIAAIYDSAKFPLADQEANRTLRELIRRETIRDEMDWSF
jgi:hypothetical protein